ncbi:bifunctional riboflavin kinase/FAD synthetase [Xylanivirga thermophila]|uniref:bifunctional riboflavin kinase/FAD synthetase n=1 Tax=Xylanivirga thermophila TaxID=2496273 RepID=UPI0013EDF4B9|nr:bifunctional riboflavin kinase/FAD synthetase [Xylanivirga thermophila]
MKIIFNKNNSDTNDANTAVALGTFDGVHLGHRRLIYTLKQLKKQQGCSTMVYTFARHPMEVIAPNDAPSILMDMQQRIRIFNSLGIDRLILNEFDLNFSLIEPEKFIDILTNNYNVSYIVVGYNFKFGSKGIGDVHLLEQLSNKKGFELIVVPPVRINGDVVSSSFIRQLISDGRVGYAAKLLGMPYSIDGFVTHGFQRGRTLGFPTVNLKFNSKRVVPAFGVYLTLVDVGQSMMWGVTNVGRNPTFNGKNIHIETYIMNYEGDLYDKKIRLYFIDKIREERKFNDREELKTQINKDVKIAKRCIYNFIQMCYNTKGEIN